MSAVNIVAFITPQEGRYDETFKIFTDLCKTVLELETECKSFIVFPGTDGDIIISKRYTSLEAYQRHHTSEYVTKALKECGNAPLIKIFNPAAGVGFGSPDENIVASEVGTVLEAPALSSEVATVSA